MAKHTQNFTPLSTKLTACMVVAAVLFFFSCKKQEFFLATKPIYTVIFNSKGGSAVKTVKVKQGDTITLPAVPTKNNSIFDGWYTNSKTGATPFLTSTAITADLTLYAKWNVFTLSSTSFTDGGDFPPKCVSPYYYSHGCFFRYQEQVDYLNVSPQLSWENAPPGTNSFFITMENISIPSEYPCWVVSDIPAKKTSLAEGESLLLEELVEYKGPFSYKGKVCAYQITIFALDLPLNSFSVFHDFYIPKTKADLKERFKAHVLASAFITGNFMSKPVKHF